MRKSPLLHHLAYYNVSAGKPTAYKIYHRNGAKGSRHKALRKMGSRECGAVTAAVNYYAKPSLLFNVSRGSFMPAPNVDSCVIRLDILDTPPVEVSDEKYFFKVVRGSFSQRRKNLANSLSSAMGMEKAVVINSIREAGLSENIRPEQLSLQQFADVSNRLMEIERV